MAINKEQLAQQEDETMKNTNTVIPSMPQYGDVDNTTDDGTMILEDTSDEEEGTTILDEDYQGGLIVSAIADEEEFIEAEATTILEDEDDEAMGSYETPTTSTLKGSTQKLVGHDEKAKLAYVSPDFETRSGQGMFSDEERQNLENRKRQEEERNNKLRLSGGTSVSAKLAEKLNLDPNSIQTPVYDDSGTAALYYGNQDVNNNAEEEFMKQFDQPNSPRGNSQSRVDEKSETEFIRDGYEQINSSSNTNNQRHSMKNKQFSFAEEQQNTKSKKSSGINIQNLPLKIGVVVVLVALAWFLFLK